MSIISAELIKVSVNSYATTISPAPYITEEVAGPSLAQQTKRRGHRGVAHDFGAKPANAPSLHEFHTLSDPAILQQRGDIKRR